MSIFMASFHNELKKIFARKKYTVFLIIEMIICLIYSGVNYLIGIASDGVWSIGIINMSMALLSFFLQVYIPLVIFMAACDLFTTEVHEGTIRATFMRPVSRFKQYFSKVAAITILAVIYLVALFLFTNIIKVLMAKTMAGIGTSFLAYLLDIIPLLVLILFTAMVNQIVNSPSLSVFLSIIVYVVLYVVGIMVPQASGLLFTGYAQWHNLWMGTLLPLGAMISKIGILIGYGLVFSCIGYFLFERREV